MDAIVVDSLRSEYNIDTSMVYLTGMSCNSEYILRTALKGVYPFKGIFPWAPYIFMDNLSKFDYNSKMPTVISAGTKDASYYYDLAVYDSLKSHGANVDLIIEQGVPHTLQFADFGNLTVKSLYYLNDTNAISISTIDDVSLNDGESKDVEFEVTNNTGHDITISALSSYTNYIPNPEVITNGTSTVKLHITSPTPPKSGSILIVVEVAEVGGGAIEQQTFKVNVTKIAVNSIHDYSQDLCQIFPNPASSELNIKVAEKDVVVQLTDLSGKIYFSKRFTDLQQTINIENYAKGIYILKVTGKNFSQTSKVIFE